MDMLLSVHALLWHMAIKDAVPLENSIAYL